MSYSKARTLRALPQSLLVPSLRPSASTGSLPSLGSSSPLVGGRGPGGDTAPSAVSTRLGATPYSDPEVLRPTWERTGVDADAQMAAVSARRAAGVVPLRVRSWCPGTVAPLPHLGAPPDPSPHPTPPLGASVDGR